MCKGMIEITKMVGGGTSWYYALKDGKVLGASHEDDKDGMRILYSLRDNHEPSREEDKHE